MRGRLTALAAIVALAAPALATAQAGAVTLVGGGISSPGAHTGIERAAGPAANLSLEQEVTGRLALRFEVGGALQQMARRAGGLIDGDLQLAHLLATGRYTVARVGPVAPYALAGLGVLWQSERFILRDAAHPVAGAEFRQTESESARAVLLGGGVSLPAVRWTPFVEGRWTHGAFDRGATTDLSVVAGLSIPLFQ